MVDMETWKGRRYKHRGNKTVYIVDYVDEYRQVHMTSTSANSTSIEDVNNLVLDVAKMNDSWERIF